MNPELHKLVKSVQTHRHMPDYCLSKTGRCRFGFPYKECRQTHLISNIDICSSPNKAKFYETKRSQNCGYINAYNPDILRVWCGYYTQLLELGRMCLTPNEMVLLFSDAFAFREI